MPSKTSPQAAQARERERQVLQLRIRGASFAEIAQALDYADKSGAYHAFRRALKQTKAETTALADEARELMLARIETLLRNLWPYAAGTLPGAVTRSEPNYKAVEQVRKLLTFQAELLGIMPQPTDEPPPLDTGVEFTLSIFEDRPLLPQPGNGADHGADDGRTIDGQARTVQ